jgi:hypothetical protein
MPANTLPAAPAQNALALPAAWADKLASQAKDVAAAERPSVSRISLRAGVISYAGQPVKGNKLPVIVMFASHINTYYNAPFDANNLQNPVCFAISEDGEDMQAHEHVPDENVPEADPNKARVNRRDCSGCAMNAWGSDPRPNSRGKACKEKRRLVLLPADAAADAESAEKAEFAVVDLPVTSGKNYSNFVNGLAAAANVPPWAAVTELSTQPDAKSQFLVTFTPVSVIPDVAVLEVLERRLGEVKRLALLPYDEAASTKEGKMVEQGKQKY